MCLCSSCFNALNRAGHFVFFYVQVWSSVWEVERAEGWLGFSCGVIAILCVRVLFIKVWLVVSEQFQQSPAPKGNLN